jgi:hypothetical protein
MKPQGGLHGDFCEDAQHGCAQEQADVVASVEHPLAIGPETGMF